MFERDILSKLFLVNWKPDSQLDIVCFLFVCLSRPIFQLHGIWVYIRSKPVAVVSESIALVEKTPTFILGPSPKFKNLFETVQQLGTLFWYIKSNLEGRVFKRLPNFWWTDKAKTIPINTPDAVFPVMMFMRFPQNLVEPAEAKAIKVVYESTVMKWVSHSAPT